VPATAAAVVVVAVNNAAGLPVQTGIVSGGTFLDYTGGNSDLARLGGAFFFLLLLDALDDVPPLVVLAVSLCFFCSCLFRLFLSLSLLPPPLLTPPILPLCDLVPAPDGPVALPRHHPCLMCHGSLETQRIPYETDRYNSKLNGEEERYSHLVRLVMYINSNIKFNDNK